MARILVTDDAAFMRMMVGDVLKKAGHEIVEACNGQDMLAKVSEANPDLITLDITMPIMDGLDALKALRARGDKRPVIMCTAMGQQAMVMDAVQNGANDFIVKPFNADRIIEAVSKCLLNSAQ